MFNLRIQRRIKVGNSVVNVSKSGASITKKFGPLTVNSRGHVTLHVATGVSFRIF